MSKRKTNQKATKEFSGPAMPSRLAGPTEDDLDRTPVAIPSGYSTPTPLVDMIARMVREQVAIEKGEEFETMEEADDFTEEDPEVLDMSPYEFDDLVAEAPLSSLHEWQENQPEDPAEPETGDPPDPKAVEPEEVTTSND